MYQIANENGATLANGASIDIELEEETHRRWVEGWVSSDRALSLLIQVYGSDWITVETGAVTGGTPVPFGYITTGRRVRVRLSNASGSSATVSYEVNQRGEI